MLCLGKHFYSSIYKEVIVDSDSFIISGAYEDGSGTWTSVYKKTKYAN